MNESANTKPVSDEELIGVLTAISVVSKRLARKLIQLNQTSHSEEGGKHDEQNKRNVERPSENYGILHLLLTRSPTG